MQSLHGCSNDVNDGVFINVECDICTRYKKLIAGTIIF
jgi:hypothetical protein